MKQVLLVDDEIYILEMLEILLLEMGMSADLARNGKEAVEYLSVKQYDLVITDMIMPEMNGRDLVKFIRSDDNFKRLPIILFSAYLNIHDVKDLLDEGVSYFLPKPVELSVMKEYIERCFKLG